MGRTMRMAAAVIVAVTVMLGSGCAWLQGVDKTSAAYSVGKYGTIAYMSGKDKLPQEYRDAVTSVWEGFRDNADKVTVANIDSAPGMVKGYIAKSGLKASTQAKANALVDKYWADLNAKVAMTGLTDEEIVLVVQALRQGIQDGLNQTNPDDNQP